jgi:antitoxin CptB
MTDHSEISRLRWQCRRGMKELDVVLVRWLERDFASADEAQRAAFAEILRLEDDVLWKLMLGRERTGDEAMDALLERLRHADRA